MGNKKIGQSHTKELHLWDCPFVRRLEMDRDFTKEAVCSLEQVRGQPCFFLSVWYRYGRPRYKKKNPTMNMVRFLLDRQIRSYGYRTRL